MSPLWILLVMAANVFCFYIRDHSEDYSVPPWYIIFTVFFIYSEVVVIALSILYLLVRGIMAIG